MTTIKYSLKRPFTPYFLMCLSGGQRFLKLFFPQMSSRANRTQHSIKSVNSSSPIHIFRRPTFLFIQYHCYTKEFLIFLVSFRSLFKIAIFYTNTISHIYSTRLYIFIGSSRLSYPGIYIFF